MKKEIKILAIETSCDETAAAVIGVENNQPMILSNIISSQIDLHAKTGGVVPEVASRAHMESIIPVIIEALDNANSKFKIQNLKSNLNSKLKIENFRDEITHIAVTAGPGLIGSLLVGFNTAKSLAYALDVPIVPINHIEGHIYSAFGGEIPNPKSQIPNKLPIQNPESEKAESCKLPVSPGVSRGGEARSFPILALTVSGGHTSLTLMSDHGVYETIGQTRDDAAGEAFDKVAKLLDLGYPGGPAVSKLAEEFRSCQSSVVSRQKETTSGKRQAANLVLPRPMIREPNFDFSFSGLKTAVLDVVRRMNKKELKNRTAEICAAFEDAVIDVLVTKTLRAAEKYQPKAVILAGGVSANKRLREELKCRLLNPKSEILNPKQIQNLKSKKAESSSLEARSLNLLVPPKNLCGDNAAMIGLAAYYHIARNDVSSWNKIKVDSNLKI